MYKNLKLLNFRDCYNFKNQKNSFSQNVFFCNVKINKKYMVIVLILYVKFIVAFSENRFLKYDFCYINIKLC